MKAVIMAGGLGTRLRPLTQIIPKPLLPIGERSVLEIGIESLKKHGFIDIIIATNYKSNLFETYFGDGSKFGVKIKFSKEDKELGTAGPLKLIQNELTEDFLVINGDILTNANFTEIKNFHLENKADITLVTKDITTPLHYGTVKTNGILIEKIEEKPVLTHEINAGIYIVSPKVLDKIPEGFYHMPELLKKTIEDGGKVIRYKLEGYWLDIGQMEDYKKAQEMANKM